MEMQLLNVGKPYPLYPDQPLPEGALFDSGKGQLTLQIFLSGIHAVELQAMKQGRAEFALTMIDDIIFLLFKFGKLEWSDAPFSMHLVPEEDRKLPDIETEESRASLFMHVVEKTNRELKVLRLMTLSPAFTRKFYECVHTQLASPYPHNYQDKLNSVYEKYSSIALLAKSICRCVGGD